jgi:hypothetical protein
MPSLVYLLITAFISLVCSLPALSAPRPDGPEVVIGPTRRDFGDVFAGEELEQNFPVRNVGNKPLELAQRSTLGTRAKSSTLQISTADWRSIKQPLARTASSRLAAPS